MGVTNSSPDKELRPRTAAKASEDPCSIVPTGPCTALVVRGAQEPQQVTWVACPRLALDLAPMQAHRTVSFKFHMSQPRPGHGPEPRAVPPALLALPQPAPQNVPLLLMAPPPLADSAAVTDFNDPPIAHLDIDTADAAQLEDRLTHTPHLTTCQSVGAAQALALPAHSTDVGAATLADGLALAPRRPTSFASRPQPAQVLAQLGVSPPVKRCASAGSDASICRA